MALIKCKECGSEISNTAAFCPRCGAKPRRTSGCTWLVLILLGLIFIPPMFSGMSGGRRRTDTLATKASSTATPPPKVASAKGNTPVVSTIAAPGTSLPSDKAPTPPANWTYRHSDYEMGKGRIHRAITDSVNIVSFDFPYRGPQRGTLILRSHPNFGKDVILSIKRGQFLVRGYEDAKALVRFDEGDPITFEVAGAEDHSATDAFFRDYQGFVEKMLKAKRVRISVPVYQQGNPVFEFDVSGFDTGAYLEKKDLSFIN